MVFSVFSFPRSFSFIYSSFTLILLISACSRFSFFVPVSRLLPLASVSNPGLLFLRCIYGFPAKDYFCFENLPAFKLSWLLTDPASAETPLALSFQRFSALKISLRSRPYLFFGRWISAFLRWGVVRIAFRLKLFCCSWDAAFWNFIRADRFPVWS